MFSFEINCRKLAAAFGISLQYSLTVEAMPMEGREDKKKKIKVGSISNWYYF